jgi:hypothetical protein
MIALTITQITISTWTQTQNGFTPMEASRGTARPARRGRARR